MHLWVTDSPCYFRLLAVPLWMVERRANTRSAINRASESNASRGGAGKRLVRSLQSRRAWFRDLLASSTDWKGQSVVYCYFILVFRPIKYRFGILPTFKPLCATKSRQRPSLLRDHFQKIPDFFKSNLIAETSCRRLPLNSDRDHFQRFLLF